MLKSCLGLLSVCCLTIASAGASEYRAINDFKEAASAVERSAQRFGPGHVLMALDIDNTLLAMDEALGSEQWFDWQVYLLNNEPTSPQLVANTFEGLLEVQGRLFDLGRMHPPQGDLPLIVKEIQSHRIATIVLTARGKEFRPSTERELSRNGYGFSTSELAVRNVSGGIFRPTEFSQAAGQRLANQQLLASSSDLPRPVSYAHGIMMVAGQNKGKMLVALLRQAKHEIKAVVFIDNRAETVAGVFSELAQLGVDVTALQYQHEDRQIQAFQYGTKNEVESRWSQLSKSPRDARPEMQAAPECSRDATDILWYGGQNESCPPRCCGTAAY
jgi:Protein of unknown function (DUF2608)